MTAVVSKSLLLDRHRSPGTATASRRRFLLATATVALPCAAFAAPSPGGRPVVRPDVIVPSLWQEPRVIRVLNANTGQSKETCYWRDGQFQMPEYLQLSALLLDHHEGLAVQLQPALFDLVFFTQRWVELATGRKTYTRMTSGFRTPRTNRLVGGAPGGGHPKAAALDGELMGVRMPTYAQMLRAFGAGGVGLYPRHVHWDVGRQPTFWVATSARES